MSDIVKMYENDQAPIKPYVGSNDGSQKFVLQNRRDVVMFEKGLPISFSPAPPWHKRLWFRFLRIIRLKKKPGQLVVTDVNFRTGTITYDSSQDD